MLPDLGTESHRLVRTRAVRPEHLSGMDSTTTTLSGLGPLISIEELSEYLNVPTRTLHDWRLADRGPRAVHIGRQLRYVVADVNDWLQAQCEDVTGRAPEGR